MAVILLIASSLLVFANHDPGVAKIHVGRDFEVVRRRLAFEYTTGEVERGTMTGTEKTARPIGINTGFRTRLELLGR
jgi:hypothetical protein